MDVEVEVEVEERVERRWSARAFCWARWALRRRERSSGSRGAPFLERVRGAGRG